MQPVNVSGISIIDNGAEIDPEAVIIVEILGISSSEPDNDIGDGNTTGDYGVDEDTAWVRAERRGGGEGRTYSIDFAGSMEAAVGCEGSIEVFVPHDQRGNSAKAEASEHGKGNGNGNGNSTNALANAGANAQGHGQAENAIANASANTNNHGNANASNHGNGHGNGKGNPNN
jgi:hypothetical protein